MKGFILEGCRKCSGDLCIDADYCGVYVSCLQCGFRKYLDFDVKGGVAQQTGSGFARVQLEPAFWGAGALSVLAES